MGSGSWPELRGELFNLWEAVSPSLKVAVTPFRVVHEDKSRRFRLLSYRPAKRKRQPDSVLFVPHIINRSYIFDLNDDVSVIRAFCQRGFYVYLIDWGYPGAEQRNLSFADYVRCVDEALGFVPRDEVSLLGYCTGGIISLLYASLHPDRVKNLILLATPFDFSMQDDPRVRFARLLDVRATTLLTDNVPGELFNLAGFQLLGWHLPLFMMQQEFASEFVSYEFWRDFWRRTRWVIDSQPVPLQACLELQGCYNLNLLARGLFRVDGQAVTFDRMRASLLNVIARYDHLVPPDSSRAIQTVYRGGDYTEVVFPSSHVGLSASRKAHLELWPEVCSWLEKRSVRMPAAHSKRGNIAQKATSWRHT